MREVLNSPSLLLRYLPSRNQAYALALGQFLSLLITGTGTTSQLLAANYNINMPTTQSFFNYILLSFYTFYLIYKRVFLGAMRERWWMYLLLALADVEANYLVVKAYQYTTITSVMLLDCFTIPCVMLLSYFLLHARYGAHQLIGVLLCLAGLVVLVVSDYDSEDAGSNPLVGDLLCLAGAVLYAISNVGQEGVLKTHSRVEYLSMIGIFGTIISGVQLACLERSELRSVEWSWPVVGLLFAFAMCLFFMYSLTPYMMVLSSATFLNLSLLTSDVYAILVGIFLFDQKLSGLYFISFAFVLVGLILYNLNLQCGVCSGVGYVVIDEQAEEIEDGEDHTDVGMDEFDLGHADPEETPQSILSYQNITPAGSPPSSPVHFST